MRGQKVRVEARLDGSIAARYQGKYVIITPCGAKRPIAAPSRAAALVRKDHNRGGRSAWMKTFNLEDGPSVWQATRDANAQG